MTLYKIPIYVREIETDHWGGKETVLHIDSVGVVIRHHSDTQLTTDFIRRHLACRRRSFALVQAETVRKAILRFYSEWEGAKIGGRKEQEKALWIDRGQDMLPSMTPPTIIELPECDKMHCNKRGEWVCGRPICDIKDDPFYKDESMNNNGEWGMCVHEGYDAPEGDSCPMNYFWEYDDKLPIHTIRVMGRDYYYITTLDTPEKELTEEDKKRLGRGAYIEWNVKTPDKKLKSIQRSLVTT